MVVTLLLITFPLVGIGLGWCFRWLYGKFQLLSAEQQAQRILYDVERDAEAKKKDIILDAQNKLLREKSAVDSELQGQRNALQRSEKRLEQKDKELDQRISHTKSIEAGFADREKKIEKIREGLRVQKMQLVEELENVSSLTQEEAKKKIIQSLEKEATLEAQGIMKVIREDAEANAKKEARRIVVSAMQRIVPEINTDILQTAVHLPSEDMKGRIIGKEGRNIRALETVTGADIVIDDTPEAVVISCFDPVRREIARQSLEILIRDGRIHPSRIEDTVRIVQREVHGIIQEKGEQTLYELGIHQINPEAQMAIGRLYYRSSYGQNVLMHSKEVAILAGMIAAEIGGDRDIAKRGGILHDVGKGIESNVDSTHVELGVEFAKHIGEHEKVVNCIAAHHGEVPFSSMESVIVQVADSISASRPGVRRESADQYLERLRKLEEIATEFEGVEKAFAIQAGRELRVLVKHETVTDEQAQNIGRFIVKGIEENMQYPGRIKVTIIRETRITEYAR